MKHGYGIYYYPNGDVYEGAWKRELRHGLGSYAFGQSGARFWGTWVQGQLEGPGRLCFPSQDYCYHGTWVLNVPYGPGAYVFDKACVLRGYYFCIRDPEYEALAAGDTVQDSEVDEAKEETAEERGEVKVPHGVLSIWHAQQLLPYAPSILPPAPAQPFECDSLDSLSVCTPISQPGEGYAAEPLPQPKQKKKKKRRKKSTTWLGDLKPADRESRISELLTPPDHVLDMLAKRMHGKEEHPKDDEKGIVRSRGDVDTPKQEEMERAERRFDITPGLAEVNAGDDTAPPSDDISVSAPGYRQASSPGSRDRESQRRGQLHWGDEVPRSDLAPHALRMRGGATASTASTPTNSSHKRSAFSLSLVSQQSRRARKYSVRRDFSKVHSQSSTPLSQSGRSLDDTHSNFTTDSTENTRETFPATSLIDVPQMKIMKKKSITRPEKCLVANQSLREKLLNLNVIQLVDLRSPNSTSESWQEALTKQYMQKGKAVCKGG